MRTSTGDYKSPARGARRRLKPRPLGILSAEAWAGRYQGVEEEQVSDVGSCRGWTARARRPLDFLCAPEALRG